MMWSGQLPEELVVEILSRLPVKPLLRFRCVSKPWRSLIDSSSFIKLVLREPWRSLIDSSSFIKLHLSKNRNSKICVFSNLEFGRPGVAETKLIFPEVDLVNCFDRIPVQSLTLPLVSCQQNVGLVGSCEGLFCVATLDYKEFYLVNPSTREYRLLPPPIGTNTRSRRHHYLASGLGYDCSADEYKFVLFSKSRSKVKIYGSKSKSWRQKDVSSDNKSCLFSRYGKYAHGALHWNDTARDHRQFSVRIAAFDLATEKLTVFEYDTDLFGNPSHIDLEVLDGQLSLCCGHDHEKGFTQHDHEKGFTVDLWVLKEYGARGSWSKLATFDREIKPVALSKCANHLLFSIFNHWPCECKFHWYDLNNKSMECTYLRRNSYSGVCIQSLVRLERKLS